MKLPFFRLMLLCGLLLFVTGGPASAARDQDPAIKDIIVTTSESDLLLFATVRNAFTTEMLAGVRQGLPVVFTFRLELVKTRKHWLDITLVESTVTHTLSWDEGAQVYRVAFSEDEGRVETTDSLDEARQLMTELNGVKVIALDQLVPDAPYAIHFKVTLKKGSLPLGLGSIAPAAVWGDFETAWRTIEFRY
jgi:hypothetical protein